MVYLQTHIELKLLYFKVSWFILIFFSLKADLFKENLIYIFKCKQIGFVINQVCILYKFYKVYNLKYQSKYGNFYELSHVKKIQKQKILFFFNTKNCCKITTTQRNHEPCLYLHVPITFLPTICFTSELKNWAYVLKVHKISVKYVLTLFLKDKTSINRVVSYCLIYILFY